MRFGGRSLPLSPDPEIIRKLAELLTETGLTEIEYAVGDRRIRVARGTPGTVAPPPFVSQQRAPASGVLADRTGAVTAPMVGTAYLAPQPGAPPFVRVGETVAQGQPLLIIEAMKVMNEIRAPLPGRVGQIFVADAQPVEYGAVLMLIE